MAIITHPFLTIFQYLDSSWCLSIFNQWKSGWIDLASPFLLWSFSQWKEGMCGSVIRNKWVCKHFPPRRPPRLQPDLEKEWKMVTLMCSTRVRWTIHVKQEKWKRKMISKALKQGKEKRKNGTFERLGGFFLFLNLPITDFLCLFVEFLLDPSYTGVVFSFVWSAV